MNKLEQAYLWGILAKTVGVHPQNNPFFGDNLKTEQELSWLEGYSSGVHLELLSFKQEIIISVNAINNKLVKLFVFSVLRERFKIHDQQFSMELLDNIKILKSRD